MQTWSTLRPPSTGGLRPGALRRADVDEIDQGGAGAQLHHAMLGQRAFDRAAKHAAIEGARPLHVADEEDDMIEAFEGEGRRRGTLYWDATKKGGRSLGLHHFEIGL